MDSLAYLAKDPKELADLLWKDMEGDAKQKPSEFEKYVEKVIGLAFADLTPKTLP